MRKDVPGVASELVAEFIEAESGSRCLIVPNCRVP